MYAAHLLLLQVAFVFRACKGQIDDPNMCQYPGRDEFLKIHQCCTNYIWNGDRCEACEAGKNGKYCNDVCTSGFYGVQCKEPCICGKYAICDPVIGCICKIGWTGFDCTEKCYSGPNVQDCEQRCNCSGQLFSYGLTSDCQCTVRSTNDKSNTNYDRNTELKENSIFVYIVVIAVLFCVVCFVFVTITLNNKLQKYQSNRKRATNGEHNSNQRRMEPAQMVDGGRIYDEIA